MTYSDPISKTIDFVKRYLHKAEGGHDWNHIERVFKLAIYIAKRESCNLFVVQLAALLHDVGDSKFSKGDEDTASEIISKHLDTLDIDENDKAHICNIIKYIGFKSNLSGRPFNSIELEIVQDADRLDAIGAIGIARTFNFGGYKGNPLYDPSIPPLINPSKDEYKKYNGTTINHFYEKLLKLKDLMNTQTGKSLAQSRHDYMVNFLDKFLSEWNSLDIEEPSLSKI